ncbi:hypothetical protein [Methanosarcina mazei]|uniref:Uncharacterized protein n=1 Tax=Methanosarcina mazei TaxID=2209 RepID=A0A0F8JVZ8_METMZ|nr:hypothetical protein [Methanosarcina mazei]KKG79808.1 hypothetical protein DU55_13120 [Methanosarcina mazei]
MSRHIVKSKPTPSTLIKLNCIEIDSNDSFDRLIVCASRFEDSLKKCGASPLEDYTFVDLFNLAIEATKIDNLDNVKLVVKGL